MSETFSSKKLCALFYQTCQNISAVILPRRCVACHAGIKNTTPNLLTRFVCNSCFELIRNTPQVRCQQCGLALGPRLQAFGWTHCRHCKTMPTQTLNEQTDCAVCCDYTAPFDQWVKQLKYGKAHGMANFLGLWLGLQTVALGKPLPDILIPVPSSREKLKQRGYNQAALIAKHAGQYMNRPTHTDWLIKTSEAGAQAEMNRTERLHHLNGLFRATRPISANLRIGLVDDVMTTGATLQTCAAALRKAGARSIVFMAICRTPE